MSNCFYLLEKCALCPRKCGVNRLRGEMGYCNSGAGYEIASVCIHRGEEPPISGDKGICNVFFPHCNLQCVYCQNHQISDNHSHAYKTVSLEQITGDIAAILKKGIPAVGFVSPTHYLPQVVAIISGLRIQGFQPVTVWNSNGYERPEMIEILDEYIDIFMPDFKYAGNELALWLSGSPDYPATALAAIRKMKEMRGPRLLLDDNGQAYRGMLIRHLILPGHIEQSCKVLRHIAHEISHRIPVSLMSQFHPGHKSTDYGELSRTLTAQEYAEVQKEMERLGLSGWLQNPESAGFYLPDFNHKNPFSAL